ASAIPWIRDQMEPHSRVLALGDDVTDEDMFRALSAEDESVIVGTELDRPTAARWRLSGTDEARRFLGWLAALRTGSAGPAPELYPRRVDAPGPAPEASASRYRLVVVS